MSSMSARDDLQASPGGRWRLLGEGVAFDPRARSVRRDGEVAALTELESALLVYLQARAGEAVTREELLREVWGYREGVQTRAVDFTVTRLRKKLERDPAAPALLQSVRGLGYRLAPPPPHPLDAPAPGPLLGREQERGWLRSALARGAGRVLVHGPPGVGKTALILCTLQEAARQPGPWEGARHADLSRCEDPQDALTALFVAASLRPPRTATAQEALRVLAADSARLLLVIDGADAPGGGALLQDLLKLPEAPAGPRLLLGARQRVAGRGLQHLELGPLPPAAAAELLCARAALPDLDPLSPELLALARALDHLPLALMLAAPMLRVLPPAELCERLRARLGGARALLASLDESLEWSWSRLAPPEQAALAQLAVFTGGFDAALAEAVVDLSPWRQTSLLEVLARLRDASLVQVAPGPGLRLGLLDSVRAFATRRAHALGLWEPAQRAHRRALLAAAPQGVSQLGLADRQGFAWLERERENLLSAIEGLADSPPEAEARLDLIWTLFPLCGRSLSVPRTLGLLDEALVHSPRLTDRGATLAHHMRGFCLAALGRYQEAGACFERSRQRADLAGNRFGCMVASGNLKSVALLSGRLEEAWRHGQAALADAPPGGRHQILYRQDLARILRGAGRVREAEALLLELLGLSPPREMTAWMARARLAELALETGHVEGCRAQLAEVERQSRERRDAVPEPMLERYLGSLRAVLQLAEGDLQAAGRALLALAPGPDGLADDDDAVERAGALWLGGDAAGARASLERSLGGPGLAQTPLLAGTALCLSSIIASEAGEPARATNLLSEARARLRATDALAPALWLALAAQRLARARGEACAAPLLVPWSPPPLPDRRPPDPGWCPPLPRALLGRFGMAGPQIVLPPSVAAL